MAVPKHVHVKRARSHAGLADRLRQQVRKRLQAMLALGSSLRERMS